MVLTAKELDLFEREIKKGTLQIVYNLSMEEWIES